MTLLEFETTKQADAVEKIFCVRFSKLKTFPMSDANSEILVKLLLAKNVIKDIAEKEKPWLYQIIEKRIQLCFTFKISDPRLILFIALVAGSPGTAVMYLAYLQYWCKQNNIKELDLDIFCERIFPMGFPCENDLHELWDSQKINRPDSNGSDNLLDYSSAYQSIQFAKKENLFPSIS